MSAWVQIEDQNAGFTGSSYLPFLNNASMAGGHVVLASDPSTYVPVTGVYRHSDNGWYSVDAGDDNGVKYGVCGACSDTVSWNTYYGGVRFQNGKLEQRRGYLSIDLNNNALYRLDGMLGTEGRDGGSVFRKRTSPITTYLPKRIDFASGKVTEPGGVVSTYSTVPLFPATWIADTHPTYKYGVSALETYDDKWSTVQGFIVGGYVGLDSASNRFWKIDTSGATEQMPAVPWSPRGEIGISTGYECLYMGCGKASLMDDVYFDDVYMYDTFNDQWYQLPALPVGLINPIFFISFLPYELDDLYLTVYGGETKDGPNLQAWKFKIRSKGKSWHEDQTPLVLA